MRNAKFRAGLKLVDQVPPIVAEIKPILTGKHPAVQGAVLADLLATWLAGHPPVMREHMVSETIRTVLRLIPCNEMEIFGEAGHPNQDGGWS